MPDVFFSAPKNRKRKRTDSAGPRKTARTSTSTFKTSSSFKSGRPQSNTKSKGKSKGPRDEELESDATDGAEGGGVDDMDLRADAVDPNESGEEDEEETPAEKRLRLAKLYLESVKDGLGAF